MSDFLQRFETHFRAGFAEDLQQVLEAVKGEKVYACAFGTDSDFITLFLAVQTEEGLARHIQAMKKEGLCSSEQDEIYYRWGCSEYSYGQKSHFNGISKLLYAEPSVMNYKDQLLDIIVRVVNETDPSIFAQYGQEKQDIHFFATITDDDLADEMENETIVRMTRADLAAHFLQRYADAEE